LGEEAVDRCGVALSAEANVCQQGDDIKVGVFQTRQAAAMITTAIKKRICCQNYDERLKRNRGAKKSRLVQRTDTK